jgi:glutamate--cysteine ligase
MDIRALRELFVRANKPRSAWRIGAEHEKIGVLPETGMPLPYTGQRSILAVFDGMVDRGWTPTLEGERVIALSRGPLKMTLEPGGQLELSGAPHQGMADVEGEIARHLAELHAVSDPLRVSWLGLGFRPYGTLDDVPWVPKGRYAIMREYLPTRARLPHEMMKRTATVQANVDWCDEADAARKLRCAMGVTSIVTALFACSPIAEGQDTGWASWRARAWLETDPDRCGLLPFAFEDGDVFARYVEWALDVPMFFVHRNDGYLAAGGMTFRRFLAEGFLGFRPNIHDWELHLSTLFPEVRFRHYLELRGADAGPREMVLALPALWIGLLYDDDACRAATELTASLSFAERLELRAEVPRLGLATPVPGKGTVLDLARELVGFARAGLARVAPAALPHLEPIEEVAATGRAPAEKIRDAFRAVQGDPVRFVDRVRL